MKKCIFLLSIVVILAACKSNTEKQEVNETMPKEEKFISFGEEISEYDVLSKKEMAKLFESLKPGDTVSVKFTSTINEVCQVKGCWMKLDLGEKETMVRFKDYGFFMPKNSAGQDVIVEGIAYVNEMKVEEQRHYAEDAGKPDEEIAQITEPKKTLSFEAVGVLLKE